MKKQIERAYLNILLERFASLGLATPKSIEDHERPDFVLSFESFRVGLEVTESVAQEYKRGTKIHFKEYPDSFVTTTHLYDRDQRRTSAEIKSDLFKTNDMFRDFGDFMRSWIKEIEEALLSKRKKLNEEDYKKFDQNWLLIFDTPGLASSSWDIEAGKRLIGSLFEKSTDLPIDFDMTFIISDKCLFRHQVELTDFHFHTN